MAAGPFVNCGFWDFFLTFQPSLGDFLSAKNLLPKFTSPYSAFFSASVPGLRLCLHCKPQNDGNTPNPDMDPFIHRPYQGFGFTVGLRGKRTGRILYACRAAGLRVCVMTQPGPVTSNTRPSPVFAVCTKPVATLRRLLVTVGPKATT